MRQKSDFLSYFKLRQIDFNSRTYFGVSHFFNRTKVIVGWPNYQEIRSNLQGGRLILGQLPTDSFNIKLMEELSPDGLIVSCCESYELSGFTTVIEVTKPFAWQPVGIDHFHLPFIDFSDKVNPELVLQALDKMYKQYQRGGTIYVHCKAGRSRSPLIVALFLVLLELERCWSVLDDLALEDLLISKIVELTKQRPQINIEANKISLGLRILKLHQKYEMEFPYENIVYTQSAEFFSKLTQSPEFKALWHFAYNNQHYIDDMKIIMEALYDDPLMVLHSLHRHHFSGTKLYTQNEINLWTSCETIRENELGETILNNLQGFLDKYQYKNADTIPSELNLAYTEFNKALARYKNNEQILHRARKLQSDIFLLPSHVADEDKALWLRETTSLLNDPIHRITDYCNYAEKAILCDNPAIRQLGQTMIYFAAGLFIVTSLIGIISVSALNYPVIIGLLFVSLTILIVGEYIVNNDMDYSVRDHSQELAKEIAQECLPEYQFF